MNTGLEEVYIFPKIRDSDEKFSYNSNLSKFLSPLKASLVCCECIDVCHFKSKTTISLHAPTLKKEATRLSETWYPCNKYAALFPRK